MSELEIVPRLQESNGEAIIQDQSVWRLAQEHMFLMLRDLLAFYGSRVIDLLGMS